MPESHVARGVDPAARTGTPRGCTAECLEPRLLLAPLVASVVGTVRDGSQLTITGSALGASGPNVVIFDDFEGGADGQLIRTGPGSAKVGAWNSRTGSIVYSSLNHFGGSKAARADMSVETSPGSGNAPNNVTALLPAGTQDLFVSYSCLIPSGTRWPGEGNSAGINWKRVWALGRNTTDDDRMLPADTGSPGLTEPNQHLIGSNDPETAVYFGSSITRGRWLQTFAWVRARTDPTATLQLWEVTGSGVERKVNRTNAGDLFGGMDPGVAFERIVMNGYGRRTRNSFPTFDDFYVATGGSARARVVIGNAPTYSASTMLAFTTPTSWSDSQVKTTFRQGPFRDGPAYLFVVSADGTVSERGFPIIIGPAPRLAAVSQVFINGPGLTGQTSANRVAFRNLAGVDNTFGYAVPAGEDQLKSIPWNGGINQVSLRFTDDVAAALQQGDLVIRGVNTPTYTTTNFVYDPATRTGTWTLGGTIINDKVRLFLDDALVSGLDGEWVNAGATEAYPSGDGTPGGDFNFRINVLRGDATRDGVVNALDLALVKQKLNATAANPGTGGGAYSPFADLTADGRINALDLAVPRRRLNTRLPTGEPASSLLFSSNPVSR